MISLDNINKWQKFELAAQKSYANYSFMMGATNDNLEEVSRAEEK